MQVLLRITGRFRTPFSDSDFTHTQIQKNIQIKNHFRFSKFLRRFRFSIRRYGSDRCSSFSLRFSLDFDVVVAPLREKEIETRSRELKDLWRERQMSDSELVARTGRQLQRYQDGCRLVAGCIPFRYRNRIEDVNGAFEKDVEVLMINSTSGPNLVFPKGGWENDETVEQAAVREAVEEAGVRGDLVHFLGYYCFKSKTLQDEFCPEGLCKAAMFVLLVKEELQFWPEQSTRQRSWLPVPEAMERCRHQWMQKALEEGFLKWKEDQMMATSPREENHLITSALSPNQD